MTVWSRKELFIFSRLGIINKKREMGIREVSYDAGMGI